MTTENGSSPRIVLLACDHSQLAYALARASAIRQEHGVQVAIVEDEERESRDMVSSALAALAALAVPFPDAGVFYDVVDYEAPHRAGIEFARAVHDRRAGRIVRDTALNRPQFSHRHRLSLRRS